MLWILMSDFRVRVCLKLRGRYGRWIQTWLKHRPKCFCVVWICERATSLTDWWARWVRFLRFPLSANLPSARNPTAALPEYRGGTGRGRRRDPAPPPSGNNGPRQPTGLGRSSDLRRSLWHVKLFQLQAWCEGLIWSGTFWFEEVHTHL